MYDCMILVVIHGKHRSFIDTNMYIYLYIPTSDIHAYVIVHRCWQSAFHKQYLVFFMSVWCAYTHAYAQTWILACVPLSLCLSSYLSLFASSSLRGVRCCLVPYPLSAISPNWYEYVHTRTHIPHICEIKNIDIYIIIIIIYNNMCKAYRLIYHHWKIWIWNTAWKQSTEHMIIQTSSDQPSEW